MIEATPAIPYDGYVSGLKCIETSMRLRRARLVAHLKDNEIAPTMTNFPLLGVGHFAGDDLKPGTLRCTPRSKPRALARRGLCLIHPLLLTASRSAPHCRLFTVFTLYELC